MSLILCATDLSETTRPVVGVAAALARLLGMPLELVHFWHAPALPPEMVTDAMIEDLRAGASQALEARAAELRAGGLDVGTHLAVDILGDGIVRRAQERHASLVVVGTHARRGPLRFFLGSVAERTIRTAPCPVVVVPPGAGGRLASGALPEGALRIVADVEASPGSDTALAWLRGIAERTPCDLGLVRVYAPVREHRRLGLDAPDPFEADAEAIAVLRRELDAHVAEHLGRRDLTVRVRPAWNGAADRLAWEAESDDADLLVIGTNQTRGSMALSTIRSARLPVVCVPEQPVVPSRPHIEAVRSVLVPTDFSPLANAAVVEAYRLLERGGGELVLAHIAAPGELGLDVDRQDEIETCLLAVAPPDAAEHGIHTRTFVAANASTGEAIVEAVNRLAPDVVVMASHGRGGVGRLLRGSVTEYVARRSPKPVLVVPAAAVDAAALEPAPGGAS